MSGRGSLSVLLAEPRPCQVCDEFDCTHQFYGDDHYRIGDPMAKHPLIGRRNIPAPHHIHHPDTGQLLFAEGDLMAAEEAAEHGVPIPGGVGPPRKKGRRQRPTETQGPQGPTEDRAHHPEANRQA